MIEYNNTSTEERSLYRSPKTKVVYVKMQGMLCSNPLGEANTTEMEEGDENW